MEVVVLIAVILIFSIIQSIFGIGLLIFGTPTLLLLGYSFIESLNIILLPSITISILQILNTREILDTTLNNYKKLFHIYCIPFLILGLVFIRFNYEFIDFKYSIGIILIIITLLRFVNVSNNLVTRLLVKNPKLSNILIGLLHGFTNMGGSFLSILASSIYHEDKIRTRYLIAYCYLLMGVIQYIFIQLFFVSDFILINVLYVLIPIIIFNLFGNKLIDYVSNIQYQKLISYIIFFYGVILIL